jgi:TolA-binding protein
MRCTLRSFFSPIAVLCLAVSVAPAVIHAQSAAESRRLEAADRRQRADSRASSRVVEESSSETQADSLYTAAREAMNDGDYALAARLFQRVVDRYPKSSRASDALYYKAYALSKAGGSRNLTNALATLDALKEDYASDYNRLKASSLRIDICGMRARQGDESCASVVVREADPEPRTPSTRRSQASCPSENDDNDDRIAALNALLQMNSENALPVLERLLKDRQSCDVLRKKAVFLVSQKRGDRAADILVDVARNDPSQQVREDAVFWLGQTNSERSVDILSDILDKSNDVELQKKAIFSLTQNRSARARQIIRDAAARENAPKDVRDQAIFWIGQSRDPENAQFLRTLYGKLRDKELKDKVIFSLAQQRNAESQRWLVDLAMNEREDIETRKNALFWAGQQGGVSTADLNSLYDRVKDRDMKEQVIFVLSQRRGAESVDALMDIVKTECDKELRGKATFWLGQSRDSRVPKFLEDMILSPPSRSRC